MNKNTTVPDIVDRLDGLLRGAIYHHFKSKNEIIEAITRRFYHDGFCGCDRESEQGKKRWEIYKGVGSTQMGNAMNMKFL